MYNIDDMSDQQILKLMADTTEPLNLARREFSAACGRIGQRASQYGGYDPIQLRRDEFKAVFKILKALKMDELLGCDVTCFSSMEKAAIDATNSFAKTRAKGLNIDAVTFLEACEKVMAAGMADMGIDLGDIK